MHNINLSDNVNANLKQRLEGIGVDEKKLMKDAKNFTANKKNRTTTTNAGKDKNLSLNVHIRLKQVREWNNYTQQEFARALETVKPALYLDKSMVSNIERGKREIEPELIAGVCMRFAISPYWLLWGKGPVGGDPEFVKSKKCDSKVTASDFLTEIEAMNFEPNLSISANIKDGTADTVQNRARLISEIIQDRLIRTTMLKQYHYLRLTAINR
ncbi:MAG: helix-turn-helix transcriptional regulator [Desulfobacteraceae bacterium]|nr:helix-turn-helix transcriptional regulator [Desulfobacteraceae bacterium]